MYELTVREHCMIAHSFNGAVFGPAQKLHGATYVVDATFHRDSLDTDGLVVDIGLAGEALKAVLAEINYQNLDELPAFAGVNTTTEYLAGWIHGRVVERARDGGLGPNADGLTALTVRLGESHVAWASYSAPIGR